MPKRLRVLLVEDLPSDVRFIKEILRDIPNTEFDITSVNSFNNALKELKNNFDVILLDLNLPDSKGVKTFESLKEQSLETPIIILTVIEDKRLMIDAVRTGAQDYLVKRFITTDSLERAILYSI
ncbi:MAG TPA: response regulator [Candidatus Nanoarchaeia archaeon]|nr:response regulator [Candidatus Nanoarchaeia archaeon]